MKETTRPTGPFAEPRPDIWEAGHRVPFFVRWPEKVRAGSTCDRTITHTDFFATFADVIGARPLPRPKRRRRTASVFCLFFWRRKNGNEPPVIHHSGGAMFAIRKGEWKLVLGNGSGGPGKAQRKTLRTTLGPVQFGERPGAKPRIYTSLSGK